MDIKAYLKYFQYCFIANIFLFFGFLTHDRLYRDDIGRSMHGYFKWSISGRPLAEYFSYIINLGDPLINTFPLPQIISICIICIGSVLLARCYSIRSPITASLCTLPLAGQPYFLENMSHTFDSPFMALGLLFSISAAILLMGRKKYSLVISFGLIFASLNLYQPTVAAFFVTYLFLLIKNIDIKNKPGKYLLDQMLRLMLCSGFAFLLYLPLTRFLVKEIDYAVHHSKLVSSSDAFANIPENLILYLQIVIKDWSGNAVGLIMALLFLTTLAISVLYIIKLPKGRIILNKRTIAYSLICVTICLSTVIASYFPQILLKYPVMVPRTFIGIGVIMSCGCLFICFFVQSYTDIDERWQKYLTTIPLCVVAFALISFAYSFARADEAQKQYENIIISRLLTDTDKIVTDKNIKYIALSGNIGKNPLSKNSSRKYPLLNYLVASYLNSNEYWSLIILRYVGLDLLTADLSDQDKLDIIRTVKPLVIKSIYSIYVHNGVMLIRFNS